MTAKNASLEVRAREFWEKFMPHPVPGRITIADRDLVARVFQDHLGSPETQIEAIRALLTAVASEAVAGERVRLVKLAEECKDPWRAHLDGNPIAKHLSHPGQNCEVQKALIVESLRTGVPS